MRKPLIFLISFSSLPLIGCSSGDSKDENAPTQTFLESIPIVYRQDIQQGNVVTQEMVDKLQPGMSKSQVRFALGTPMLVDSFHLNRWDYLYTFTAGWGETEQKQLTLYFEADRLVKLEGDYRPNPAEAVPEAEQETVISIPDYVDPDRGILSKAVDAATSAWSDENPKKGSGPSDAEVEKRKAEAEKLKAIIESSETPQ